MNKLRSLRWRLQHWLENKLPGLMTCAEFEETLDAYIDGELGPVGRTLVDLHIAMCPLCKRYVMAYGRARDLAVDAVSEADAKMLGDVPEDLISAIMAARTAESRPAT